MEPESLNDSVYILYENVHPPPEVEIVNEIIVSSYVNEDTSQNESISQHNNYIYCYLDSSADASVAEQSENISVAEQSENISVAEQSENISVAEQSENISVGEQSENISVAEQSENISVAEQSENISVATQRKKASVTEQIEDIFVAAQRGNASVVEQIGNTSVVEQIGNTSVVEQIGNTSLTETNVDLENSVCILRECNRSQQEILCVNRISANESAKRSSDSNRKVKQTKVACGICFDGFDEISNSNRTMMSTNCGHIFCDVCLKTSMMNSTLCPKCRKRVGKKQFHPIYL